MCPVLFSVPRSPSPRLSIEASRAPASPKRQVRRHGCRYRRLELRPARDLIGVDKPRRNDRVVPARPATRRYNDRRESRREGKRERERERGELCLDFYKEARIEWSDWFYNLWDVFADSLLVAGLMIRPGKEVGNLVGAERPRRFRGWVREIYRTRGSISLRSSESLTTPCKSPC